MRSHVTARNVFIAGLVGFLLALPLYTGLSGNSFLLTLFTRILILALAATRWRGVSSLVICSTPETIQPDARRGRLS